ncbi:MAG TPA: hypothetical protein VFR33_04680 [Candidatus Dormibacteraeota bacterium]|nr:hypothetical protein [Candidatus Dormibacteraeota bacterium]
MDANLARLEGSASTTAARYGRMAAAGAGVLVVAAVAFIVYRRTRKPTLRDRLNGVSVERVRDLVEKLREELPSVTVTVNDGKNSEPGMFESIVRKVAPAMIGTASTALFERMSRPPDTESQQS